MKFVLAECLLAEFVFVRREVLDAPDRRMSPASFTVMSREDRLAVFKSRVPCSDAESIIAMFRGPDRQSHLECGLAPGGQFELVPAVGECRRKR
jgi:hypothetical protein